LIARSAAETAVILCAEAVPWRCHRRLIADALVARGLPVLHIMGPGRADPHELDANARIVSGGPNGRLVYPGSDGAQASLLRTSPNRNFRPIAAGRDLD